MVRRAPLLLLTAATAAACAPEDAPARVQALLPADDDPRSFALGDVELESITDLRAGRGEWFDVRGGFDVNAESIVAAIEENRYDLDEMIVRGRADPGDDVAARMSWDGDRWVAEDFDTLHYFTMVHNLERAWRFARDVAGVEGRPVDDHGVLGFYSTLATTDLVPVPVRSADNAAYVPYSDAWLTFRVLFVQQGVPYAMNPGVVAHEFHHRVFFLNVFGGEAFENWRAWLLEVYNPRATNLLRGLDEGLADVFAAAMVRDVSFITPTGGGLFAPSAEVRDLDASFAEAATYDALADGTLPLEFHSYCRVDVRQEDQLELDRFNRYCAGTAIARVLWEAADFDYDVLREHVVPAVSRALPEVGRRIAEQSGSGEMNFELEMFFDAFAAELPASVRATLCESLAERFEELVTGGGVPACG